MNLPDHAGSDVVSDSRNARPRCRQRGMSLIEQIMVLAIIAVLLGIATPPLRQLLSRNALRVAQADFITALRYARETAIISGKRTLFCPTRDGNSCNGATRWENGWLLGRDGNLDDQPDDGPLHVGHSYDGKVIIHSSNGRHAVRFQPDGSARGSNITLLFCQPSSASRTLAVVVSNAGRIRGAPANADQVATCAQLN
ncbi:GspH/FimT family pseudopilin [Rhodanobacter thiooxydans]|uniref:GspH/FimT family pseudopilin n=2 Tax=Rhodanobacter thiooxydans TaxID=416169 RepID=UPI002279667D|nr:GspH/FimT family pseudopilin [Rhodanobacter thiooxydans]